MSDAPRDSSYVGTRDLDVPCLIYDAGIIMGQHERLRSFLDAVYPNTQVFYALKACYCPQVVNLLVKRGCGLELLSADEHRIASACHVEGHGIVWNGCALSDDVLSGAVTRGEWLNVDSPSLFHRLEKIAAEQHLAPEVGLRINIDGTGKLGMEYDDAVALISSSKRVRIIGLHFHESPQSSSDQARLLERRQAFVDVASRLEQEHDVSLQYVDLGGGLLSDVELAQQLGDVIEALRKLRSKPTLFLEPGAYFVEDAGTALTRVIATKRIGRIRWAAVDIGMNMLVPLNRARFTVHGSSTSGSPAEKVNIAGSFGVSADIVALDQVIAAKEGDTLRIERCGAYTESMSSCMITTPPPIYWLEDGRYEEIKRRLAGADLFMDYHGYTRSVPLDEEGAQERGLS
jgi:diaminopimelate decarboxylase